MLPNIQDYFWRSVFNFKLSKTYIPPRSRKTWENVKNFEKKSFGFGKKKFWHQYRYWNWTLVSVPDTETWFQSYTRLLQPSNTSQQNTFVSYYYGPGLQKLLNNFQVLFLYSQGVTRIITKYCPFLLFPSVCKSY